MSLVVFEFDTDIANEHGVDAAILIQHFVIHRNMSRIQNGKEEDPSINSLINFFNFWSKEYICDTVKYCLINELI